MAKFIQLGLVWMLAACSSDASMVVEATSAPPSKNTIPTERKSTALKMDFAIIRLIATNGMACLLSEQGQVYCWSASYSGKLNGEALTHIHLGGRKAKALFGGSGSTGYFQTGDHICATLADIDSSVMCWGGLNEDSLFDAEALFEGPVGKTKPFNAVELKADVFGGVELRRLVTSHSVICGIDSTNTLHCPHAHLSFLNGMKNVKDAVIGEILSCVQGVEDNEISCFDMRREAADQSPIFLNLSDESWPTQFNMRYIYAAGIGFVTEKGALLYWSGGLPDWDAFPGVYGLPSEKLPLAGGLKAKSFYISERSACALLSNGEAGCWGRPVKFDGEEDFPMPGERVVFDGPITDIALGNSQNCFLVANQSVHCFTDLPQAL